MLGVSNWSENTAAALLMGAIGSKWRRPSPRVSKRGWINWVASPWGFLRRFLVVCIIRSTFPLLWWYFGLLVMCVNPQSSANLANSAEEYCGPLSQITAFGIPWRAKTAFKLLMITSWEGGFSEYSNIARCNLPRGRILVLSIRLDQFLLFGMDARVIVKESWALHD